MLKEKGEYKFIIFVLKEFLAMTNRNQIFYYRRETSISVQSLQNQLWLKPFKLPTTKKKLKLGSFTQNQDKKWTKKNLTHLSSANTREPFNRKCILSYVFYKRNSCYKNSYFSGEKLGIDVRFNPRREGSYNLELILEYHIKSLMGLAKTIKKETLALNGIAKGTENSLRLDSNFIVFEKEELQKETALSSDRLIM